MRIGCKLVLCLVLLCLFICCFNGVSAADISVSDIDNVSDGDFVVNNNMDHIGDSVIDHNGGQFNDIVNLSNYKSSKYNDYIVDKSNVTNVISKSIPNSFKYDGSIVDKSKVNNSSFVNCVVSCEDDFKNVSNQFKKLTNSSGVIVNITSNIGITHEGSVLDFNCNNKTLVIFGNGFNISVNKPNLHGENHFLNCGNNSSVLMSDLRISGFNTAINNYGNVLLQNVTFLSNRMNYWKFGDYGGAIWNRANLLCLNCSFISNLASYGGAIFSNETRSNLGLINCYFKGNEAYGGSCSFWNLRNKLGNSICENNQIFEGHGHDVMVGGNGIVYSYYISPYKDKLRGPGAFVPTPNSEIKFSHDRSDYRIILRNSMEPVVREFNITDSKSSLANAINGVRNSGDNVDIFIINLNTDVTGLKQYWNKERMPGFNPHYGNIIFNGNGHKVTLEGASDSDEYHFATITRLSSLLVNDLKISGFNCAVMNNGTAFINNVTFSGNHVKYVTDAGDDAGAINNLGLLVCNDCTFVNNFGLWAGAIYGAHGAHNYLNNCTFIDNKHSKNDGADLYSYNDAKFFIGGLDVNGTGLNSIEDNHNYMAGIGLEVNGTGLNSIGINNHHINGTNITVGYGYPPAGAKKVTLQLLGFGTQLLSFGVGFGLGMAGCPIAGILIGGIVGSALKISGDLYHASLTHTSYNCWNIPIDIISHFLTALGGAEMGYKIYKTNHLQVITLEDGRVINLNYDDAPGKVYGEDGNMKLSHVSNNNGEYDLITYKESIPANINGKKYQILSIKKYSDKSIYSCIRNGKYIEVPYKNFSDLNQFFNQHSKYGGFLTEGKPFDFSSLPENYYDMSASAGV